MTGPVVILVDPQLGENIGMVARAMLNLSLTDLRLVRPRDGWPNDSAVAAAAGADVVLENAQLFERTEDAVRDLNLLYATTARPRDMTKTVVTPEEAGRTMRKRMAKGDTAGFLFGPEAMGLANDDVALADAVLTVPLNPEFSSLNLAQAVFVAAYAWFCGVAEMPEKTLSMPKDTGPASKDELLHLFEHLEGELDRSGFLRVQEKRPTMVRNLRNLLGRAELTRQEVQTLRGVISSLTLHRDKMPN